MLAFVASRLYKNRLQVDMVCGPEFSDWFLEPGGAQYMWVGFKINADSNCSL